MPETMLGKTTSIPLKAFASWVTLICSLQFSTCDPLAENELLVEDLKWETPHQPDKILSFRTNQESVSLVLQPTERILADDFHVYTFPASKSDQRNLEFKIQQEPARKIKVKLNGTFYSVKGTNGTIYVENNSHGIQAEGLIDDSMYLTPGNILSEIGGYTHTIRSLKSSRPQQNQLGRILKNLRLVNLGQRSANRDDRMDEFRRRKRSNSRLTRQNTQQHADVAFIETLVIFDHENTVACNRNYATVAKYIGIFWNQVQKVFDQIKNPQIRFNITGAVMMMKKTDQPFIEEASIEIEPKQVVDAEKLIKGLTHWLYEQKLELPEYDMVVVQTRLELNYHGRNTVSGMAKIGSLCRRYTSCLAVTDEANFYTGILKMVHEVAHVMKASHDDANNDPECRNEKEYIMSRDQNPSKNAYIFSKCSVEQITNFLNSVTCVRNNPMPVPLIDKPPVEKRDKTALCRERFGEAYSESRRLKSNCQVLHCIATYGDKKEIRDPPEGTQCDNDDPRKICINGECKAVIK